MDNAVLFAAGSCWEGVDFPGDMVSSLIIVKLPFAVPDPISEAQKKEYASLKDYIQAVIVPDMQKKLRQGFGRALRTETDTISPGKSTPSQQEPAAKRTALSICLNLVISSGECLHTSIIGNGISSLNIW